MIIIITIILMIIIIIITSAVHLELGSASTRRHTGATFIRICLGAPYLLRGPLIKSLFVYV